MNREQRNDPGHRFFIEEITPRAMPTDGGAAEGREWETPHKAELRLEGEIRDRLAEELDVDDILVSVKGGLVLLAGKVPDAEAKARAAEIASETPGVTEVKCYFRFAQETALA